MNSHHFAAQQEAVDISPFPCHSPTIISFLIYNIQNAPRMFTLTQKKVPSSVASYCVPANSCPVSY